MKKIFDFCFDKWWRPILFFSLSIVIVILCADNSSNFFKTISFILLGFGLLGLVLSSIYQFTKKRWLKGILTGFIFLGSITVFIIYVVFVFFIETIDGDKWADNLKIPTNIQIDNPIDLTMDYSRPDSVLTWKKTKTDFQLYNSFQPGLYQFDFWTGKIEKGKIYIKAYEITQEYALSADRLSDRSAIDIYNPTDSILTFSTTSDFTIYEGDWGKPYAARFEVWFRPENGESERKLFFKNYIIEGWQR